MATNLRGEVYTIEIQGNHEIHGVHQESQTTYTGRHPLNGAINECNAQIDFQNQAPPSQIYS